MQTIRPAANQLFCEPEKAELKTKSGFLLTEGSVEQPKIATVINAGSKVKDYKSKDKIIYKPYTTTEIKLNKTDYFLVAVEDVLGVVVEVE